MNSKEIAKMARVSRSTVSKVVNDYANISDKTREKVIEIIKKYGYVPQASARNLAGKSNKMIGVFITDVNHDSKELRVIESDYFSPFATAAMDYADKFEYNILTLVIDKNRKFDKARKLFYNKTISGGIFIGAENNVQEIFELIRSGYKLVIIDQERYKDRVVGKHIIVNSKNLEGAYKATKHLIEYGHREIAHICGDMNKFSGFKRLEGYKKAIVEAGLPIRTEYITEGDFTEDSGYESAKKLLKNNNKITGIFASSDNMAIGAMRFIKEIGLRIPDDISIVGYDDIKIASYISPSLTTIRVSILDMASIAVKSLINFIEKDIKSSRYNTVSTELVIRQSSKRIKE
ncbi:MAG: LacI family DNA-binding transcriptional regulator [Actinomycetota bacterium]|nr:LacI family DNA-binding transcriptional regulator [Actinomycetota bacterium]